MVKYVEATRFPLCNFLLNVTRLCNILPNVALVIFCNICSFSVMQYSINCGSCNKVLFARLKLEMEGVKGNFVIFTGGIYSCNCYVHNSKCQKSITFFYRESGRSP